MNLRTRSPRWRAGTRRNRRMPVTPIGAPARCVRRSDCLVERRYTDWAGWHEAALCVTEPEGRNLMLALAGLSYDPAQGSRPDHAARAVSIDACFGARLPERVVNPASVVAGSYGRSATPLTTLARRTAYLAQGGVFEQGPLTGRSRRVLSPAQLRRMDKKYRRTLRGLT